MRLRLVAAAIMAASCASALAEPVTYTLTSNFTGTLGALSFTDAPGTITLQGDTSSTVSQGAGFYSNTSGVSSIQLAGVGTALFLSPTFGASSSTGGAGFFDVSTGFGASVYDPALTGYALTAPFSDTSVLLLSFGSSIGASELTTLGALTLSQPDFPSATFTATTTAAPPTVTPEPGSFALLLTGGVGTGSLMLRRLRRTRD